jgi:hypothetical protein
MSRVARSARWLPRREAVMLHADLTQFGERRRANIYFGVCPRPRPGDAHDQSIKTVRCLWCDIDDAHVEEARRRWTSAGVPPPSIVVNSGSGIHAYWLLKQDLTSRQQRRRLQAILPNFYRSFGGDHVQNLSRVMRPPGTLNYKDARNGRPPLRCTLCTWRPELRYPLAAFVPWMPKANEPPLSTSTAPVRRPSAEAVLSRHAEAAALAAELAKPSRDRSRRDFAIVCALLRLGLSKEEIWPLVADASKFESSGWPYFDRTIANAQRTILLEEAPQRAPQSRAS